MTFDEMLTRVRDLLQREGRVSYRALKRRFTPDGERKTITALFADIQGSMDLPEGLDPEDARRTDPGAGRSQEVVRSKALSWHKGINCSASPMTDRPRWLPRALGLPYLDLEEILRALMTTQLLTTEALSKVIAEIEEQDHTRTTAKDQILGR